MVAVLAAGTDAALSHISAAAAWDLRRTSSGLIHVMLPGRAGRARRAGLRIHRCATLTPQDIALHRGIPVTSPERTIIDLSRSLKDRPLEHVIDLADQRGLISFDRLWTANSASLKAVLELYAPAPTRSEMEERFLRLCDDHQIARPDTNSHVEGFEVDFVWRDENLIVEVDGYKYHRAPTAFEDDRARDVELTTRGYSVTRFTWNQITRRSGWVAAAIRSRRPALARRPRARG
jgi:very-short-patch-repair endonuclease